MTGRSGSRTGRSTGSATSALDALLGAQYPNGAWPQRFDRPPDAGAFPVKAAGYPETWSRTFTKVNYQGDYTLNDSAFPDAVYVMLEAATTYHEPRYRASAEKAGGFLLLARMPEPQPAWAQQYDSAMHPAWARQFEPPSVTGGESQEALRTLLRLYRATGDTRFLDAVPGTLEYLRRSRLPDGRLARFYELKTNRPLYFSRKYELTYDDGDMPTHYAFKVPDWTDEIDREYQRLRARDPGPGPGDRPGAKAKPARSGPDQSLTSRVKSVVAALDESGRWVTEGKLQTQAPPVGIRKVISTDVFVRNVGTLARYLDATRP